MNIRNFIREQLEKIVGENSTPTKPIKGFEILNYFPFNKLPETRDLVDWSNRGVNGWGDVFVPSLNGNGMQQILAKDDMVGSEPWAHPKTGNIVKDEGYIENFKKKFGDEPIFVMNPSAEWFGKITVINDAYKKNVDAIQSIQAKGD